MTLTAEQIIDEIDPYKVINDKDIKGSFIALSKRWHPDVPGGNNDVFAKVSRMRDQILELQGGEVEVGHVRTFRTKEGRENTLIFQKKFRTDTGMMYLCQECIAYVEDNRFQDVFNTGIPSFKFKDDKMKNNMVGSLPTQVRTVETDSHIAYIVKKDRDMIPLKVLMDHLGPVGFDPVHAAWVTSRMLNLNCYLGYIGLAHIGFNPLNLLVNPMTHGAALLGGWRLATPFGKKFKAVPQFTARHASRQTMDLQMANPSIDLEPMKAMSRTLFGDVNGRDFHPKTPKSVRQWLTIPAAKKPLDEFKLWEKAISGFGPRVFVEMNVDTKVIYKALRTESL